MNRLISQFRKRLLAIDEVLQAADEIETWPLLIRPAFTLGGLGGGTAYNTGELVEISQLGLRNSRIGQVPSKNPYSAGKNMSRSHARHR